jgi:hypothetical protein
MKANIRTYISSVSFHHHLLKDIEKYDHYYPLDDLGDIAELIDWDGFYLRGMIYMEFDGIILFDEKSADMIPEAWRSFLNAIFGLIEKGSYSEISYDQGFRIKMKQINPTTIEICNDGGNGFPPAYVYGSPKELLPPIFEAIQECYDTVNKYDSIPEMLDHLVLVKAKAEEWMKSFR